jgi:hypothetical protein
MDSQENGLIAYWLFAAVLVIAVLVFGVFAPELIEEPDDLQMMLGFALVFVTIPAEVILFRRAWKHFKHTKLYNRMKEW